MKSPTPTPPTNPERPAFNDARGRAWRPRLDYVKLRHLRDRFGVDLGNVHTIAQTWAELLYDDLKSLDVLWLAAGGDDAEKDDWLASMDGPCLEAARAALRDAIYLFTPPLQKPILLQGMEAVDKTYRLAITQAESQIKTALDTAIQEALTSTPGLPEPAARES